MGQGTDQIEQEIESQRKELGKNLMQLETKTKELTDWRVHFQKRPMAMLGLAFGGGLILAGLLGGGRRRHISINQNLEKAAPSPHYDQIQETWDTVKGALIGVAATRVKDFVGEFIPGFQEQIRAAETKRRA